MYHKTDIRLKSGHKRLPLSLYRVQYSNPTAPREKGLAILHVFIDLLNHKS